MVNYGGEKMIISELAYHKLLRNGDISNMQSTLA